MTAALDERDLLLTEIVCSYFLWDHYCCEHKQGQQLLVTRQPFFRQSVREVFSLRRKSHCYATWTFEWQQPWMSVAYVHLMEKVCSLFFETTTVVQKDWVTRLARGSQVHSSQFLLQPKLGIIHVLQENIETKLGPMNWQVLSSARVGWGWGGRESMFEDDGSKPQRAPAELQCDPSYHHHHPCLWGPFFFC